MSATRFPALVTRLSTAIDLGSQSDGQLIGSFVAERDQRAFALLVRRHGPMVLAVCQRLTGHAQDAEDAFQGVFLTLARRAGAVAHPEAVGNWLYGVAVRTAREARAAAARRRAREAPTDPLPDPGRPDPDPLPPDARAALYEELARLPDKYRTPVVLCDLGGEPQAALARRLGVPVGTVYSRLATARARLAGRLRERGIGPLAVGVSALGAVAVSPRLIRAATAVSTSGSIPPAVSALLSGALRTMYSQKLTAGAVLLAVGVVLGTLAGSPAQEPSKPPAGRGGPDPASAVRAPIPAAPARPGTLVVVRDGELVALTPKGGAKATFGPAEKFDLGGAAASPTGSFRFSPDGKRVAYLVQKPLNPTVLNFFPEWRVVVRTVGKDDEQGVDIGRFAEATLSWSPDGSKLVSTRNPPTEEGPTVLIDPATGKTEPLELPAGAAVCEWCRDGKTFLVAYRGKVDNRLRLGLVEKGEKAPRELTALGEANGAGGGADARFSPDGKKLLFLDIDPTLPPGYRIWLGYKPYVLDVATKKREPLAEVRKGAHCVSAAWSPDGKRVAYAWLQLPADRLKVGVLTSEEIHSETDAFLSVADADGKNPTTVLEGKAKQWLDRPLGSVDWR
jgi:RNA polymerase sigma factor (sigma-70 family)